MLLTFKKFLDKSTIHFDTPSEKIIAFFLVIITSCFLHYAAYQYDPSSFKIDEETLGKNDPTIMDFGWFSTFSSFGFYFGEIVPKSSPIRLLTLAQVISVWYIMLS
tara:strand:- start:443 stop:760 length:318 start_codon:yes stop_codon:yes gene_type:complete